MLIGVCGKKRHGKGTVANILKAEYGFIQIDFADRLREMMAVLDPIVGYEWDDDAITYNQAIAKHGYEEAKEAYPEIVRLLQVMGTDVGRNMISRDLWVQQWEQGVACFAPTTPIVTADVRFISEAETLRTQALYTSQDYLILKVVRPGYIHNREQNKHKSEQGFDLSGFTSEEITASTVAELTEKCHATMALLNIERRARHE